MKYTELPYDKNVFDKYNAKTFPQIFVGEKHIGGWSEFYKYVASTFNYDKLYDIAYLATVNLNQVIDINYYPVGVGTCDANNRIKEYSISYVTFDLKKE